MNQTQTLLQILYQHEKGTVSMIEQRFEGVEMETAVKAVYEQKRAAVAALEGELGKGKSAS